MSSKIRNLLEERPFLTNAGTETYLVFQQGFELPDFCAFVVFDDPQAWTTLETRFLWPNLDVAARNGFGLLLDALVWRAQPDFLRKLGHPPGQLHPINVRAVSEVRNSVARWRESSGIDERQTPVLIVADIGPRGDGYKVEGTGETREAAQRYHTPQLQAVADAGVDLVCALTMTSPSEAIGIVEASRKVGLPIVVSPTVETDGRLPDGTSLGDFIQEVDAATNDAPLFYMVNCAHPTHLGPTLDAARAKGEPWLDRFRGFRANASKKSHEELDNSTEIDRGDIAELADAVAAMRRDFALQVVGGCCGTDHEHIEAIARASLAR